MPMMPAMPPTATSAGAAQDSPTDRIYRGGADWTPGEGRHHSLAAVSAAPSPGRVIAGFCVVDTSEPPATESTSA
jgi:hypothetical protein